MSLFFISEHRYYTRKRVKIIIAFDKISKRIAATNVNLKRKKRHGR